MLGFRVWDTAYNKFKDMENLFINGEGKVIKTGNFIGSWHLPSSTRYILMQSTGLKDCEGVMIYEGDIIEIKHAISEFRIVGNVTGFLLMHAQWHCMVGNFTNRVIGNKYSNPELLEKIK